jgi:hypothetical protein
MIDTSWDGLRLFNTQARVDVLQYVSIQLLHSVLKRCFVAGIHLANVFMQD